MAQLINLVVRDRADETRYKLLRPIGKWGPAFSLPVYEAAVLSQEDNKTPITSVAFKIISNLEENYFNMALQDLQASQFHARDPNIMPFITFFQATVKGVTLLCIVLPYDSFVTSLRSLIISDPRFSRGMHESMIALVIKRALTGLDAIHQHSRYHTRITADTVFYDLDQPTFYIAYAASLYERTVPPNHDEWNCLPVNRMLAWGLAPEVKHDDSLNFVDVYVAAESDIWLIGILALELAYGRILVEDRRELLDIAKYINSNPGVLTDTWEELRIKSAEFAPGGDPLKLPIVLPVKRTRFSERFRSFLASCLAAEPQNRPSAEELVLQHEFLRVNVGKMSTFINMFKGTNLHVARFLDRDVPKKRSKSSNQSSFRHNGITYTILEPIGKWGPENSLSVYEAVATSGFNDPCPQHVAIKMVRNVRGEFFDLAMDSVERNTSFNHMNILPLNTHFCKLFKYDTLCIVLPFDAQVLSLRSIISTRPKFANGIPQYCIAVVLLHTLKGLHVLHSKNQYHYDITAGNIFYHIEDKSIKLAYAASVYERTCDAEEFDERPMNNLLSWASPPEVEFEHNAFKADIWFIGIAALELAYGRIRVAHREELLRIASYISTVRKLPNTWEELRFETAKARMLKTQPNKKFLIVPTASQNPLRFDDTFGNFVAMCLGSEPNERPSANELLMDGFFRHIHEGESMEIFKALMIKGYKDSNKKKVAGVLDQDGQKKQATSSKQSDHLSFCHNGITYTILEPIGTWGSTSCGSDLCLTVYEAVTTSGSNDPSPQHVAIKMANKVNRGLFQLAEYSVTKNIACSHINIVPLNTHFFIHLNGHETLCMILPFDAQVMSLRSIIQTRPKFANGIPQTCIAVALLHTVRVLHLLHTEDQDHYEITAGNIFYHIEDESIKLALAASTYERTYAAEKSGECPINELSKWGRPPEVDVLLRSRLIDDYDFFKSDIWSIGIVALELAYGKIRVVNRGELHRIASYISKVRRLPDTWEELRTETAEAEIVNPQRFDKSFGNFVAKCLETEPNERPFANELLMDDFLKKVHDHEGESMEMFKAVMIKGYRDLDKEKAVVIG